MVKDGWMEFEGPSVKPRRDQVQRGHVLSSAGGKALGQERKETEAVTTVALTHLTYFWALLCHHAWWPWASHFKCFFFS